MKKQLRRAFTDSTSRTFYVTNDVLAFFTIVSIISLILETVPALTEYGVWFSVIEFITVAIFALEYGARLWVTKPWRQYAFSFYGVIDLISILPSFVGLGNYTFLKSVRMIRLIRFLRIVRLAKLSRLPQKEIEHSVGVLGMNIVIYTTCLLFALVIFGIGLYVVESNNPTFESVPLAIWWSLKVFMGDVPSMLPTTVLGDVFYVAARFTGLLLLGVLVGVVGNIFREVLLTRK